MKIYDITKFTYKEDIKPELRTVYVKHKEDKLVYVTTDSFRLIEVSLDDFNVQSVIKEGFYLPEQWKVLAKETQKTYPNADVMLSISPLENKDNWHYPEYERLIPTNFEDLSLPVNRFDIKLVKEFTDLIQKITKKKYQSFSKELQQGNNTFTKDSMLYYQGWSDDGKSEIKVMLMPLSE